MKELQKVYLWGSRVTEAGVAKLQTALPTLQIYMWNRLLGIAGDIYEQACQVGNGAIAGCPKHQERAAHGARLFGVVGFDAPCD